MKMDSKKSFKFLNVSIHSLLGLKPRITSGWVESVCNIIKSLPVEGSLESTTSHNGVDNLGYTISAIKDELAILTTTINHLNVERKHVLNEYLELKGNIRVFCRVRPIMLGENFGRLKLVAVQDSSSLLLKFAENKSKIFSFDKVFPPCSSQDEVFSEVEPIIKSAMDGYNACIFAYGQTGTGKTYTMEGSPDCPGVVPCAMAALFKQAADSNCAVLFKFSMLEIYMNNLKDLLIPRIMKRTDTIAPCLLIKTDPKGEVEIDNLMSIQVSDFNQAMRLYKLGCRLRSTASTNSNKSSSRSHCMIRISMTCSDANERRRVTNKLWMVDLGGSERVLKTKASGRRLDEGKAINLSLSSLGDVINALQSKKSHIPYRNSKLTQVLKDSLGNDSKTLMLVHVSPKEEDMCETICSLNFATRVKSIHLGHEETTEKKAEKEVAMTNLLQKMKDIEDKREELQIKITKLNEQLENLTSPTSEQLEVSNRLTEAPQSNTRSVKKFASVTATSPTDVPRFMKPTVCSKQRSGIIEQTSGDKKHIPARRRRASSYRAESVTFPAKDMSQCNSETSLSRASCLVSLNTNYNADNETEYSQDTAESDTKPAIFYGENHFLRSSNHHAGGHLNHIEDHVNKTTQGCDSKVSTQIDNWLNLYKNAPATSNNAHRSKCVLAIPISEKQLRGGDEQEIVEKLQNEDLSNHELTKNLQESIIKKVDNERKVGMSISQMVTDAKERGLTGFAQMGLMSDWTSSHCTTDNAMMLQEQDIVHNWSVEESKYRKYLPCDTPDKDHGGIQTTTHMQAITAAEAFMLNKCLQCNDSTSYISKSIICLEEEFDSQMSRSEEVQTCQEVPFTSTIKNQEAKLQDSVLHSEMMASYAQIMGSQKGLSMEDSIDPPLFDSSGNIKRTGTLALIQKKMQILCSSILLGLGLQGLGFGDDFFYGLVL